MQIGEQLALVAAIFWSVAVILIRLSGLEIPALGLTLFKTFVAALAFALTVPLLGAPWWPTLSPSDWGKLALSGILGISVADTMVVAALNRLGASLHALADCLYAPSMALVGYWLLNQRLNAWELTGTLLVMAGIAFGMRVNKDVPDPKNLVLGVLLAGGAHVIMAVGILMVKDVYAEHSVFWVSGVRFAIAGFVLAGFALISGQSDQVRVGFQRRDLWKWTIPLSLLGPYLATVCWALGFVYTKAGRAAVFNQMSTVLVTILAYLVLKEDMNSKKLVGLSLAIAGSIIVGTH